MTSRAWPGQNLDMQEDLELPDFETLVEELRVLRERGLADLRRIQPPGLSAVAQYAGLVTDDDAMPAAIEALLREAAEIFGDVGADRDAAEYTFGLAPGYRLRSASDRRVRAAEEYGIQPDSFRKEPERALISQMAEGVLGVARAVSRLGAASARTGEADSHELATVKGLSTQLAADLDLVTISGSDIARQVRLSDGLYVPREQEARLLAGLRDSARSQHVLVLGEAGHGKSSLLWSIHRELEHEDSWMPLLVSAAWLIDEPGVPSLLTVDKILAALSAAQVSGARTALLLDTADLMLHHEVGRQRVL